MYVGMFDFDFRDCKAEEKSLEFTVLVVVVYTHLSCMNKASSKSAAQSRTGDNNFALNLALNRCCGMSFCVFHVPSHIAASQCKGGHKAHSTYSLCEPFKPQYLFSGASLASHCLCSETKYMKKLLPAVPVPYVDVLG